MSPAIVFSVVISLIIIGFGWLAYWQLVIAEGALIGQWLVTLLYDLSASRYDNIKKYDTDMESMFLGRPLAQQLAHIENPLVLDIGTGTARLPITLLERPAFSGTCIGIDASLPMLELAAEKTHASRDRLTFIWRDASELPFPDNIFDCVTCLEMLEFTPEPSRQIAEAMRVLRPGGILLTTRRRSVNARLMPGKIHSQDEFKHMLKLAGLVHIDLQIWQVDYDLVWAFKPGTSPQIETSYPDYLRCVVCDEFTVREHGPEKLMCASCHTPYPVKRNIIHFE